ncbi:MAG: disulfide bond formation protein B [Thiotrichales bacterium]|nr:MAG: disulfide bond formation protein B [Thiotrichales bacterium]
MLGTLHKIARSRWYWIALVLLGLSFITVALYYQYVLEQAPCVLCIQVRIWILCLTVVAFNAYLLHGKWISLGAHLLTAAIAAILVERSYQLLGTERGFIFSDCGFDLGLPSWLPLDTWFPALFRVEASCGYTPELMFGITMAEALIVFSTLLLLFSLALTVAFFVRRDN